MILFRNWCLLALAGAVIAPISARAADSVDHYGGRDMIVHVPARLPARGSRALVVVLHGGMGNADRIANSQSESGLNLDAEADRDGFVVVYLNGTPVTRLAGARALGWNAGGGCCGQPARNGTDDVAYISGAVGYLAGKYGIDRSRVFGIGHSNGAMMTQRILCETSLYAAGVAISGPLNLAVAQCPSARGRRILAIHGANDQNVPIAGGRGARGLAQVAWSSEARARQVMTGSGASYDLQIVPGADHMLDHLSAAIAKSEGLTIARKAAAFFGLTGKKG
ncbi:MAG: prolyl oligopeptidase family serine peptidase [Sphingomonas bacterium]